MTRVILSLILVCQPFCPQSAEIGFAQPDLLGLGKSEKPKVVVVHQPGATRAYAPDAEAVSRMFQEALLAWTGAPSLDEAWKGLVSTQDVVGVKVHAAPGPASGTRPAVVSAVVRSLLAAGHPPSRIIIWDRRLEDLRAAGFTQLAASLGVRAAGAAEAGYDPEAIYANPLLGNLVHGDLEFQRHASGADSQGVVGRNSHLSRLLTREITRQILIAPLLNHIHAGVSGILYTAASASVDNFIRFENNPRALQSAVPEIYGQTNIADRVVLNVLDALIGQYEGRQQSLLQYSEVPDEIWVGADPVAMDVLAIEALNRIRERRKVPKVLNGLELYSNARLLELGTDRPTDLDVLRIDLPRPGG